MSEAGGMPDEEFEALVARLQVESAAHPRLYRLRVVLLAAMGYGFLVGLVIALVLITIGLFYILFTAHLGAISVKVLAPLAALVFIMLRALWVTVPRPVGMSLTAERAPGLFALLQEVREQVNGPVIHQVLLDGDFNAAIVQVPRLGVLGWQQNFLVLGLPLMQMLPTPEFRSVLVHEMGHLVGAHGRFGIWIYRQRNAWGRLLVQLEAEKRMASAFFSGFLKWYSPLFNAYTFVMARAHEYDADRLAAEATSPRVTADALTRIAILSGWIDREFWTDIQRRTRLVPLPPEDLFGEMAGFARRPADGERIAAALETVLASKTGSADTHPSLRARLEALRETARPPAPFEVSAAEEVLGDAFPALARELNRKWYDSVVEPWRHANAEAEAQRKRLAALEASEAHALSPEERWERACILLREERGPEAEPLLESVVIEKPDLAPAHGALGMVLLERGDERGLVSVDRALELGGVDVMPWCKAAHDYLLTRGRTDDAARYAKHARAHLMKFAAAQMERATYVLKDAIEPHGLPPERLLELRGMLEAFADVQSAWLVRKKLEHFPEDPLFILAFRVHTNWKETFLARNQKRAKVVRDQLPQVMKLGNTWIVSLDLASKEDRERFEKKAGPPFYQVP